VPTKPAGRELLGLRWIDLELSVPIGQLHVRQRWGKLPNHSRLRGPGQHLAGMEEGVSANEDGLRDLVEGQVGIQHYVFPNGAGFAENHANPFNRGSSTLQIAAGLSEPCPMKRAIRGSTGTASPFSWASMASMGCGTSSATD